MLELGSTISSSLDETDKELLSHGFKAFLPTADKSTADKSEENGDNSKEGVCTYRGTQLFSCKTSNIYRRFSRRLSYKP